MTLCKNDVIETVVESLGYRGEGVARAGRIPVFINGALPGEKVRALVILVKKDFCVGRLLEVIVPSIERVEPVCPFFLKCGGCNLQHLDYSCQLQYKSEQVSDALRKIAGIEVPPPAITGSPLKYGYRNKISLPVRLRDGRAAVGLYAYNSHRIVEMDACPLQSARTGGIIPEIRRIAERLEPFDEERDRGELKHVTAREINGKLSLTFVVRRDISGKIRRIAEENPGLADEIWMNVNPENTNVILGRSFSLIAGNPLRERIFGFETEVHPAGFLQVNEAVASMLYEKVMELARESSPERIIDAYCGGGMLTAMLSGCAEEVTGVEIVEESVRSAREFHRRLGLENTRIIAGDCARVLPDIAGSGRSGLIVLDPPRTGCDERVTESVNGSGVPRVIYVSCNPSTLARDIGRLYNYKPEGMFAYDMFPQTCHVEVVTALVLKTPK